jgi:hypothetical protein
VLLQGRSKSILYYFDFLEHASEHELSNTPIVRESTVWPVNRPYFHGLPGPQVVRCNVRSDAEVQHLLKTLQDLRVRKLLGL